MDWRWRLIGVSGLAGGALAQDGPVRTGAAALGDWQGDRPGVWRKITPRRPTGALRYPRPLRRAPTWSTGRRGAQLHVLPGFKVSQFASGQDGVRLMRTAPNGDVFLAMQTGGEVRVMRTRDGADKPVSITTFAGNLDGPFGIAFYPARAEPAVGVRRKHQRGGALSLPQRRPQSARGRPRRWSPS